jgi:hypothetical protein
LLKEKRHPVTHKFNTSRIPGMNPAHDHWQDYNYAPALQQSRHLQSADDFCRQPLKVAKTAHAQLF